MNPLTIKAADLHEAISSAILGKEILGHVLLQASGETLTVTSSSGPAQLAQTLLLDAPCEFAAVVDANSLKHTLNGLAGDVTIEPKIDHALLKQGKRRYRLPVLPCECFPIMDAGSYESDVACDVAGLCDAIGRVSYAASRYHQLVFLNGVCINPDDIIACDSLRLATVKNSFITLEHSIIIPATLTPYLTKYAAKCNKVRLLSYGENSTPHAVLFSGERLSLTLRLLDATYPDLSQHIEKGKAGTCLISVDSDTLKQSLSRLRFFEGVGFITVTNKGMVAYIEGDKDAQEPIDCKIEGEPIEDMCVTLEYIEAVAAAFPGKELQWRTAANMPHLFMVDGVDETHFVNERKRGGKA